MDGEGQPFALAAVPAQRSAQVMQDPSFGMDVELYEGEAEFSLPVRVAASATPGAQKLVVSASYQSCNNKVARHRRPSRWKSRSRSRSSYGFSFTSCQAGRDTAVR